MRKTLKVLLDPQEGVWWGCLVRAVREDILRS